MPRTNQKPKTTRARKPHTAPPPRRSSRRFSNADLIAALSTYARIHKINGAPFTIKQFNSWPARPCCAATILSRFRTWRNALSHIHIHNAPPRRHSCAALLADFERLWRRFRRPPGVNLIRRHSNFSIESYRRRWGSCARLAQLITQCRKGELTRAQLLNSPPPPNARTTIPISIRWQVVTRDRFRCTLCGQSPATNPAAQLHLDHIQPLSKGGTNDPANLRTLCRECNVARGNVLEGTGTEAIPAQPPAIGAINNNEPRAPASGPSGRPHLPLTSSHPASMAQELATSPSPPEAA